MKKLFLRNTLLSAAIHIAIVTILLIFSITLYQKRHARHEITTFIDLKMPDNENVSASATIPEPIAVKPRKRIELSKKLVKRSVTPQRQNVTRHGVQTILKKAMEPVSDRNKDITAVDEYLSSVRAMMYKAWHQPGSLSAESGLVTHVLIRVANDGRIMSRKMIESSGNEVMDSSVMKAVNSVDRIRKMPVGSGNRYKNISIAFELSHETKF